MINNILMTASAMLFGFGLGLLVQRAAGRGTAKRDDPSDDPAFLAYRAALQQGDLPAACKSLLDYASRCPHRTERCFNGTFCPDCPHSGMPCDDN